MKALILAGGRGTRLGELTATMPKPMVPVCGRPFLELVLERLVHAGIDQFVISLHHFPDAIRNHFGDCFGSVPIRYVLEPKPMGTGGAILYAMLEEPDSQILVVNGDSFLAIDYADLLRWHAQSPLRTAIVVRRVADAGRYGSLTVEGDTVTAFREKGLANSADVSAGTYVLRPETLRKFGLSGAFSIERDFFQRHCAEIRPRAYLFDGYFIDIGVPADLERARLEIPGVD